MRAVLKGQLFVPYGAVADLEELKKTLSYRPRPGMDRKRRPLVQLYMDMPEHGGIAVPQAFGREYFGHLVEIDDRTTLGGDMQPVARLPDPNHEAVEDPVAQAAFMASMLDAAQLHRTFIARAPTGTGKTAVACRTGALLGRRALTLVHMERLRVQWVEAIQEHLGMPPDRIGVVKGKRCEWEGKDWVVGMLPSVALKPGRYPREFYEAFGTVFFDELHKVGAPIFSRAAWQFPARYRIGMTATTERKDDGAKVYYWHLGQIRATSRQSALPMQVHPVWYDCGGYRLWGNNHGARMKCLSQDHKRNNLLGQIIYKMYTAGRQAIVVGEGIQHLQNLMAIAKANGVPEGAMGQFTGQVKYLDEMRTGNRVQRVSKSRTQKAATLERIKRKSQIIFATYGMMKEGIDIPRLDGGVDATPRSDAAQLIGRIRRSHPGKRQPVLWVTIVDAQCDRSLRYFQMRCQDYEKTGAEVINGRR